jgi:hypothetical protein
MHVYVPVELNICTKVFKQFVKADVSLCGVSAPSRKSYLHHQAVDVKLDLPGETVVRKTDNSPITGLMPVGYFAEYVLLGHPDHKEVYAVPTRRMVSWLMKLKKNINDISFQWAYFLKGSACLQTAALIPVDYLDLRDATSLERVYTRVDPDSVVSFETLKTQGITPGAVLRDVAYDTEYLLFNNLEEEKRLYWILELGAKTSANAHRVTLHHVDLENAKTSSGLYVVKENSDQPLSWGADIEEVIRMMADTPIGDLDITEPSRNMPHNVTMLYRWMMFLSTKADEEKTARMLVAYWLVLTTWQAAFSKKGTHRPMTFGVRQAIEAKEAWLGEYTPFDRVRGYCPYSNTDNALAMAFTKGLKLYWRDGEFVIKYAGQKEYSPIKSIVAYTQDLLSNPWWA